MTMEKKNIFHAYLSPGSVLSALCTLWLHEKYQHPQLQEFSASAQAPRAAPTALVHVGSPVARHPQ